MLLESIATDNPRWAVNTLSLPKPSGTGWKTLHFYLDSSYVFLCKSGCNHQLVVITAQYITRSIYGLLLYRRLRRRQSCNGHTVR